LSTSLNAGTIKQRAQELGFDLCGVAPALAFPELQFLPEWLARGYAGEMEYMAKSAATRADIRNFLPSARSVIVTGTIYNTAGSGEPGAGSRDAVRVAKYALGQDYHVVLGDRLRVLVEWMRGQQHDPFDAAIFVDKHHVQERVYAQHAGVGWIGKNTCVINRDQGSWMFLAGIATSLDLQADAPALDHCGACTLCIDACPTGALVDEHVLDATKCISYLTIEVDGPIPEEQRAHIGNHVYGCDICQDVCPWNLAPPASDDEAWRGPQRDGLLAADLWLRSDFDLHTLIKGSAMTYLPLSRLRRNLATVMGNTGEAALSGVLDQPGGGVRNAARSTMSPVVEDAVAWARRRLAEK
jgi:epoxyqueuosine reductase